MSDRMLLLSAALAGAAFLYTLWQLSSQLHRLESRLEEGLNPPAPAPRNSGKAMFSGLYPEPSPGFLTRVTARPGGAALLAAGLLVVVTLLLGMTSRSEGAPGATPADPTVAALNVKVDSLLSSLTALRDSLGHAEPAPALASAKSVRPTTGRPATQRTAPAASTPAPGAGVIPAPALPPAPSLDSNLVSRTARP